MLSFRVKAPPCSRVPALAIARVRATGRLVTLPVLCTVPNDLFAKAEAGERWITVHPHGDDEKGVPVLIHESKTNPGTWQVIGGAGGKLNYLRLTGVKSPQEYKERAAAKRRAKKEADQRQQELTKERRATMTPGELEQEKQRETAKADQARLKAAKTREHEDKIIADVAQQAGWDADEWQFDATARRLKAAGAKPERIAKLAEAHHKRMLRRTEAVLEASKAHLLAVRAKELGEMPLDNPDPDKAGLSDVLEQPSLVKGKGFQAITRTSSDAKIKAALAGADVVQLAREAEVLAEEVTAGGGGPDAEAKLMDVRAELRAAQLMREGATMTPAALEQRRKEVGAAKAAVAEQFDTLRAKLSTTPADAKDEREKIVEELTTTQRQMKVMAERAVDVELMAGATVQPAVTGEKKAVMEKRRGEREREIAAEGGDPQAYRAMLERMELARDNYQAEMKRYRETGVLLRPTAPIKPITSAEKALQLLGAQKALKRTKAEDAKEADPKASDDRIFGKGYFAEVGKPTDAMIAAAEADITNKINEQRTRAFLSKIESPDLLAGHGAAFTDERGAHELGQALERHMGAGSYNVVNNVALAALHQPVLSREAADVLGAAGAAQILAHALRQSGESPAALREMAEGMAEYHVEQNVAQGEDRVREAEEALEAADEVIARLTNPEEVGLAMEANRERDRLLEQARQTLGQALGEYEATAALVQALGQKAPEKIDVTLGPIGAEASIRQLRAIGLQKADYEVHSDGTNFFATIKPSGMDRLTQQTKPDPEHEKLIEDMLAIKRGDRDEADYLPAGSIVRPSSTFSERGLEPEPLTNGLRQWGEYGQGGDAGEQLEETIARRAGSGEPLNDILADVSGNLADVSDAAKPAMQKVLNDTFPTTTPVLEKGRPVLNADGSPRMRKMRAEEHGANVEKLIKKHFERLGINANSALHSQELDLSSPHTAEALTRALAADPRAMVAFHPLGELTKQDQRALRHYYLSEVAKPTAAQGFDEKAVQGKLDDLGPEPTKTAGGLFGGEEITPEWLEWKRARDTVMVDAHGTHEKPTTATWDDYTTAMGGRAQAYGALQDALKSKFLKDFHTHYTTLTGTPLRVGAIPTAHATRHVGFLNPKQRAETLAARRAEIDASRERQKGKYAVGAVLPKLDRIEQHKQYEQQNQVGFGASPNATNRGTPGAGERYSIGARAEGQLASILPGIARNFRTDTPVAMLKDRSFTGKIGGLQQRGIKAIMRAKRLALGFGAGTGKTGIFQSAFAALKADPKSGVKRGVFLAPSSPQEQFGPEFARFIQPGALNWAANTDSDRAARMREHTDPETHAVVHTHQAFRDDMLHVLGEHWGTEGDATTKRFMALDRKGAAAVMKEAMEKKGIDYQYMVVDEGHGLLDRAGKPDSILSRVMQGASDNMKYYVAASADPVKNDVTEVRSQLDRLYPDGRYSDAGAWQRRYGVNTTASAEALKREIAPSIYAESVPGMNKVTRERAVMPLHPAQQKMIAGIDAAVATLRAARANGTVDVEAAKTIAPGAFAKLPAEKHEELAKRITANPGTWLEHAHRRAIDLAPAHENAKIQKLVADLKTHNPKDKPAVVFVHNLAAVDEIKEALTAEGHRVATLTGSDGKPERAANRKKFQPPPGRDPEADVFVLSDAGSTGLNLQRGSRLYQYDRPMTAMTHAQRNARIDRLGQKNPVELTDLVTDSDYEARAQRRIDTKYELRDILTDPAADLDDTGVAKVISEARRRAARPAQEAPAPPAKSEVAA